MTLLARVRIITDGYEGGPGYNVLHFSEGTGAGHAWDQAHVDYVCEELHSFITNSASTWINDATVRVDPDVAIIDAATGEIQDMRTWVTDLVPVAGSGSNTSISRGQCLYQRFYGDKYLNGRRLAGGIFLGPLAAGNVGADGKINGPWAQQMELNWSNLTSGAGARLAVWHRPSQKGMSNGDYADVARVVTRRLPSNLRSRQV